MVAIQELTPDATLEVLSWLSVGDAVGAATCLPAWRPLVGHWSFWRIAFETVRRHRAPKWHPAEALARVGGSTVADHDWRSATRVLSTVCRDVLGLWCCHPLPDGRAKLVWLCGSTASGLTLAVRDVTDAPLHQQLPIEEALGEVPRPQVSDWPAIEHIEVPFGLAKDVAGGGGAPLKERVAALINGYRRCCTDGSLAASLCSTPKDYRADGDDALLHGLHWADYGAHGRELLDFRSAVVPASRLEPTTWQIDNDDVDDDPTGTVPQAEAESADDAASEPRVVPCIEVVKVTGDRNIRAGRVSIRLLDAPEGNRRTLPRGVITLRGPTPNNEEWCVWHEAVFALLPARVGDPDALPAHIETAMQAAALVQWHMHIMPFRRCFLGADVFTADGVALPPGRLGTAAFEQALLVPNDGDTA
jgi:hypothetical protein